MRDFEEKMQRSVQSKENEIKYLTQENNYLKSK